jgi:RimJ/RimL family protein N-acetyltransferase
MNQPVLLTERLTLAAPSAKDIDQMFILCQDETIQEMVLPIGRNYTRDKADVFISTIIPKIWSSGAGAEFAIKLSNDPSATMIGMVGVSFPSGEVGLWLGPEHRRQGIGEEALRRLLDWAASENRIPDGFRWTVLPHNLPSIRLAEKFGFGYSHDNHVTGRDGESVRLLCGSLSSTTSWPVNL